MTSDPTSPPLSEGPSPEETKVAEGIAKLLLKLNWINSRRGGHGEERSLGALYDDLIHDLLHADIFVAGGIRPSLAQFASARERSAHLEDARAGCEYCGDKWPALGFSPVPSRDTIRRWVHVKVGEAGYYASDCGRPEVWDALSLLPPKGTK